MSAFGFRGDLSRREGVSVSRADDGKLELSCGTLVEAIGADVSQLSQVHGDEFSVHCFNQLTLYVGRASEANECPSFAQRAVIVRSYI